MRIKKIIKHLFTIIKCRLNHIGDNENCYIGFNVKIVNNGKVQLGKDVIIRPSTYIYVGRSSSSVTFGDNTEIGNYSTISSAHSVKFGKGVLTGPHVFIADHNHEYKHPHIPIYLQGISIGENDRVLIDDGTWLGTNVVVVGNVHIGKNCVIGANSVVTHDIPDYSVAVGIPAKVIKRYNFEKKEWQRV